MALPDITRISPNKTAGWSSGGPHIIVVHGTRGGADYGVEFTATLNWFSTSTSQVSAHWVIARDGTTARCVPDSYRAWHVGIHNVIAIGIELEQPNISDQITTPQYEKLHLIGKTYPHIPLVHITDIADSGYIEHMETPQGIAAGKSDVGQGFNWNTFLKEDDMALAPEDHETIREIVRRMKWQADTINRNTQQWFEKVAELQNRIIELEGSGGGNYTDADARKAIKDRL